MDTANPVGAYVHAHEQDRDGQSVFVAGGVQLPPARGRVGFRLQLDGSGTLTEPGPTDAPVTRAVRWQRTGAELTLTDTAGRVLRRWRIITATPERMVLVPLAP